MNLKKGFEKIIKSQFLVGMVVCSLLFFVLNLIDPNYPVLGYLISPVVWGLLFTLKASIEFD